MFLLKEKREVNRLPWCLLKIDQKVLRYVKIAWCLLFYVKDNSKRSYEMVRVRKIAES